MKTQSVGALGALMLTLPVFAATQAVNAAAISPTLKTSVSVQEAIQLTLGTGSGCAVTGAGGGADYNVSFGNIDAMGINNGSCGNKFAPTTPGSTNAAYYTDYTLTPIYTSQATSTGTITAYVSANFTKANLSIVQAASAPGAISDLAAMSTNVAAQTSVATNAASGTPITRYVGVSLAPTNNSGLTGNDAATITYTLTVP